ncbi:hypothetical protein IGI04_032123 [Brassica rapa subsp. trilocularis]|uniref:RNase H type-1 domain-containing protein n=1 Tax=Brassica rapa subsp. trilocularis TaxID=1813537 RepID=A0ABQ7LWD1_BRACM|nr:hypothetical protein IGI04_032123 [Brassica rapa subsp. trilocularis]
MSRYLKFQQFSFCRNFKKKQQQMYIIIQSIYHRFNVSDLWFPNSRVWNAQKLFDTFTEEDALQILKIKPLQNGHDLDVWGFTKTGSYTTQTGFSQSSVFLNLHYMVAGYKQQRSDRDNLKAFPWILWNLWKGRNALVFENIRVTPNSTVVKALEEAEIWYQAQQPDQNTSMEKKSTNASLGIWEKPPSDMVKCNVGMAWVDTGTMSGASWIARDYQGQPLHHSRQALIGSSTKRESDLRSLLWAVQAMGDLRHKNILFEASSVETRQALLNPTSFPDLSPLILKILELLNGFEKWTISHVSRHINRAAATIAESVTFGPYLQSYVASGGPRWLHKML